VLVLAALLMLPPGARAACDDPPPGVPAARTAAALSCDIGAARAANKLGRLHMSKPLTQAATRYARQMATRDFFSHVSPDGSTLRDRILASGWVTLRCSWHIGEVLAWGGGAYARASWVIGAWMQSAEHRPILLGPDYWAVGVGVVAGAPMRLHKGVPGITVAVWLGRRDCPA
jgi:uncharacterized protein YkwD